MPPPSRCNSNMWTIDHERILIDFYEDHKFLWHLRDPHHMNRVKRNTALQECILLLGINDVNGRPFTLESLKGKFTNLRTTFQREIKKIEDSKVRVGGTVHIPKWNHYDRLLFLKGADEPMDSLSSHDNQSSPDNTTTFEIVEAGPESTHELPLQLECTSYAVTSHNNVTSNVTSSRSPAGRRRDRESDKLLSLSPPAKRGRALAELITLLNRVGTREETPEDVFGQHVASSLKAMPTSFGRENAKLEIQKIIFEIMVEKK